MIRPLSIIGLLAIAWCAMAASSEPPSNAPPGATDWGGGYYIGVDTAMQMSSNSATGASSAVDDPAQASSWVKAPRLPPP